MPGREGAIVGSEQDYFLGLCPLDDDLEEVSQRKDREGGQLTGSCLDFWGACMCGPGGALAPPTQPLRSLWEWLYSLHGDMI